MENQISCNVLQDLQEFWFSQKENAEISGLLTCDPFQEWPTAHEQFFF